MDENEDDNEDYKAAEQNELNAPNGMNVIVTIAKKKPKNHTK